MLDFFVELVEKFSFTFSAMEMGREKAFGFYQERNEQIDRSLSSRLKNDMKLEIENEI